MNKRIERISSYINEEDKVADIGCDQALLSELLAKRKIHSIASDIKSGIIESAKKRINGLKLSDYVEFIVSDGVKNIPSEIDTLVISGMGTHTILKILGFAKKQYKKIITISNNNHSILRKEMIKFGYEVDREEIIYEKNKYYNLIVFKVGISTYSKEELLFGKNHQNLELFNKKLEYDLNKNKKIYTQSHDIKILDIIKLIEKKLMYH